MWNVLQFERGTVIPGRLWLQLTGITRRVGQGNFTTQCDLFFCLELNSVNGLLVLKWRASEEPYVGIFAYNITECVIGT
jgi:hypothetical protein